MTWRIHHVSLPTRDVRETAAFYTEVLGMAESSPPWKDKNRGDFDIDLAHVAWFQGENAQVHLSRHSRNFARDNNFHLDPIINGHVAIEVDDLDAVRERLRRKGVYFADPGNWALTGLDQIYVLDPALNAVEINSQLK